MKWNKRGLIFSPNNNYPWMVSHAANPIAESLGNDYLRVFFSCRDKDNRSSVGFIEFDLRTPHKLGRLSGQPVLRPGELGSFDDSGASIGCLARVGRKRYLYYTGWNLGVTVPWRNSIGLATCDTEEPVYRKYSQAPILDRNEVDPFSISYPWVMQGASVWKMWYGSNLRWGTNHSDMDHIIKYAESPDGIHWSREGVIAIPIKYPGEWGISKPCVIQDAATFKMWYSYRGSNYRIGYAESNDGIRWERKDSEVGIDVTDSGWDSEMIEYPFVFDHNRERYMLYNGNGYGKTGIGLAILEKD